MYSKEKKEGNSVKIVERMNTIWQGNSFVPFLES